MDERVAELRDRLGELVDRVRTHRAYLAYRGVEAREFLAACTELDAMIDHSTPADVSALLPRIIGFAARLHSLPDWPPQFSETEAAMWAVAGSLLEIEESLATIGLFTQNPELLHTGGEPGAARVREAIAGSRDPFAALEDLSLFVTAEHADLDRRIRFRTAALSIYWEQMPEEKRGALPHPVRASLADLLQRWHGERESVLSTLPIADRARLEAMEQFTAADWTREAAAT